jgi:hypothetical protein
MCGNRRALNGPAAKPARAVRVPAGNDANVNFSRPHTTYWFAPGEHTLGSGQFQNIDPANGDTYVGAPGAVLDQCHLACFGHAAMPVFALVGAGLTSLMVAGASCLVPCWPGFLTL